MTSFGLGALAFLVVLAFVFFYNRLISLKNQVDESWSGIDVQLKRRHDMIPNLVETVKGYAQHESGTLEKVIQARNMAAQATGVEDKAGAENLLSGALKSIFALSERYPQLKANENFLSLQKSLTEVEDNLQNARRYYNAVVRDYNIACETFPSGIVATFLKFPKKTFFEVAEADRENVKVSFQQG